MKNKERIDDHSDVKQREDNELNKGGEPPLTINTVKRLITQEVFDHLKQLELPSYGLFQTLKEIAHAAEILDLEIILIVAEESFISIEKLQEKLHTRISRSTLYRRISRLIDVGILQKKYHTIELSKRYKSLELVARISHRIR